MLADSLARRTKEHGMLPFDPQRDLNPLADLIELSFKDELDHTDARIVADLRRLADTGPLLWLLGGFPTAWSRLMRGYVWLEEGRLVGNVTLNLENAKRGLWNISNVAVHPDYRGRGLARRLLSAAVKEAREEGGHWIMLEVRIDNPTARHLYDELGFELYDTIAEMSLPASAWKERSNSSLLLSSTLARPGITWAGLRKRRAQDWQGLFELAKRVTPSKLQELRPIRSDRYHLGLDDRLNQWIDDWFQRRTRSEWVLEEDGEVTAFLQVVGLRSPVPHHLEMAVRPEKRGSVEARLLAAGLRQLERLPGHDVATKVSLAHAEAHRAYEAAGFLSLRVLDQMQLNLRRTTGGMLL